MFYIYYLILFFGMGVLFNFIPVFFKEQTPLTSSQVTMMMSFVPLLSFVSQNFFAFLSDKTKKYKTVLLSVMIATIISCLMLAFSANAEQVFIVVGLYFLFALFYPATGVLSDNFTLEYSKKNNIPYGRIRLFGSAGYAIAGQVAGFLTDSFGLTIIFYVYAVCILVPMFFIPKFPEIVSSKTSQQAENAPKEGNIYRKLFANKQFLMIMLVSFFILVALQVTNNFFGLYITDYAGLSRTFLGTTVLLSAGTEIPMMFFTNKLIEKFGVPKILVVGALLNSIRFLVYFLMPGNVFAILLVTATHGIGYGAVFTSIMHLLAESVPSDMRATAISLNQSLAVGIGSFGIGFFSSLVFNPLTVYIFLAALEFVGFLICLYLLNRNKQTA